MKNFLCSFWYFPSPASMPSAPIPEWWFISKRVPEARHIQEGLGQTTVICSGLQSPREVHTHYLGSEYSWEMKSVLGMSWKLDDTPWQTWGCSLFGCHPLAHPWEKNKKNKKQQQQQKHTWNWLGLYGNPIMGLASWAYSDMPKLRII